MTFIERLRAFFGAKPALPAVATGLNRSSEEFILSFEGMDQPSEWPGEESGISIGHGYDLGYITEAEFRRDWSPHLTESEMNLLATAIGKKGQHAHAIEDRFTRIKITKQPADAVFKLRTVPKWVKITRETFPGSEKLPPDAFGALVSLVFNRGNSLEGQRRIEMRQIKETVGKFAAGLLTWEKAKIQINASLWSMKRLWPDNNGLMRRRNAEAHRVMTS